MEIIIKTVLSIIITSRTVWLHENGDLTPLCKINFLLTLNTPSLHFSTSEVFYSRLLDVLLWKLKLLWKRVATLDARLKSFIPFHSIPKSGYISQLYWLRRVLFIDEKVLLRHGVIFNYFLCFVFSILKVQIKVFLSLVIHIFFVGLNANT